MSRSGDPQDASNQYDEPNGYNQAYENERERGGSLFPYSVPWGGWSNFFGRGGGASEEYGDRPVESENRGGEYEGTYDEEAYDGTTHDTEDDDSWWEEGLAGTLILVGVVLFFFPEPATSVLGIVLLGVGVLAWIADALT